MLLIAWQFVPVHQAFAQAQFPLIFRQAAEPGFGDPQNNGAWSMQWWNGKLYVGTVRSWFCWSQAWFHMNIPLIQYPPDTPGSDCAADPLDLPLQAEIWRFTPDGAIWERVYQAPMDVEIPGHPGKFTARDVGYRGMTVFTDPDGTEALYVSGVTINTLWPQLPPPRILRSEDGTNFAPLPQDPGTVLGDLGFNQGIFRSVLSHQGRLYILNGKVRGEGWVLESDNPAAGNDSFRWVTPQDMQVFEMVSFNEHLYLGVVGETGYSVVKVDTSQDFPYEFEPVVTDGAYLKPFASRSVVSMHVFKNRLYVGTNSPTELIRINPDDSWDLIVGQPRMAPDGWKFPLSGFNTGFDWPMNVHLWRMQDHEGVLYAGTLDQSTRLQAVPLVGEQFRWQFGFDLYRSSDGEHFSPVTINGLGNPFQMGIRTFASTPEGLFVGTVSYWEGLQILRGTEEPTHQALGQQSNYGPTDQPAHAFFVPLVAGNPATPPSRSESGVTPPDSPAAHFENDDIKLYPALLYLESMEGRNILAWEPAPDAQSYRIFRAESQVLFADRCADDTDLMTPLPEQDESCLQPALDLQGLSLYLSGIIGMGSPEQLSSLFDTFNTLNTLNLSFLTNAHLKLDPLMILADSSIPYWLSEWENLNKQLPGPYLELDSTQGLFYVDSDVNPARTYRYYVSVENEKDNLLISNIARSPVLKPVPTFDHIRNKLESWLDLEYGDVDTPDEALEITDLLENAEKAVAEKDWETGVLLLMQARAKAASGDDFRISDWHKDDLELLLVGLIQRIRLLGEGLLDTSRVN